ncbi:MAG: pyrimidine-nucleoside phosphorylase [Firmicutes bacterium]|jgi:pyrimidine-nucleoside phosphorylase|nr:pyrimidine-nucleoside phosphorylase [Bacillota bacterium]MDH7495529.1 pyrimidine-nucleoside phosphorylase [Bacillota bacterium]
MRAYDVILKKRRGEELSPDEIAFLVDGFTRDKIPDYQMAAWCMAVFFQGMSARETRDLTIAMAKSGDEVDLSQIRGIKVDKHSTGGVGDKTTLVLAPLVAASGVPVAKMSGRGLGHTGGTLDKLESIPGFRVDLPREAFVRNVNSVGLAVVGQTAEIAPADKKLYALRDVTATVDSIPLIASSVCSKKLACGSDAIVFDVKTGSGAFMKSESDAHALARLMVDIMKGAGRKAAAVVSDMNQPLGRAVGNALEVREAIETLRGEGPPDLVELCLTLGSVMLVLGEAASDTGRAREALAGLLRSGAALAKFSEFVRAQGGDASVVERLDVLPSADHVADVPSPGAGYVAAIDTEAVGVAAMLLGAGRRVKDEPVDPAAGLVVRKKLGDWVSADEPLAVLHTNDRAAVDEASRLVASAYSLSEAPVLPPRLIRSVIDY